MKKIPKRFSLLGYVVHVRRAPEADDQWGEYDEDRREITLHVDPKKNVDRAGHTYCHELVHAILDAMKREDLNNDETFVDLFGGLLWQALKTAE